MKKKLTIAYVSDAIYPYNKGGKEKRIYELTTRLAKAGHTVTIYCMKWWKGKDNERIENGVKLHAISPYIPLYSGKRRSMRQAIVFAASCLKLLNQDFDVLDADHMPHLILFPLKLVALMKRKKLYTTWNEVWGRKYWIEYLGPLGNIAYIVEWISARLPDEIIAVSRHTKEMLINNLGIHTSILTIPNGIDFKEIEQVKPAKEKSDIIFAGRLLSHKNVDVILKSLVRLKKENPHIQAFIIGDGPERINLEKMSRDLGIEKNVRFFNFLEEHNYLYALMKASRVFVFPSTREGFGIVALEANASGIPVITTNHPHNGTKDLIHNGENGSTAHLKEFEKVIKSYLVNKQSSAGYTRFAKNYDWAKISTDVERAYL